MESPLYDLCAILEPWYSGASFSLGKRMPASTRVTQEILLLGEVRLEHGRKEVRRGRM